MAVGRRLGLLSRQSRMSWRTSSGHSWGTLLDAGGGGWECGCRCAGVCLEGCAREWSRGAQHAAAAAAPRPRPPSPQVAQPAALGRQPRADLPQHDAIAVDVGLLSAPRAPQHLGRRPGVVGWGWASGRVCVGRRGGEGGTRLSSSSGSSERARKHRQQWQRQRRQCAPCERGDHPRHVIAVEDLGHPHVRNLGSAVPAACMGGWV